MTVVRLEMVLTIVREFDADPAAWGTDDPEEMARAVQARIAADPLLYVLDSPKATVKVEVVEG